MQLKGFIGPSYTLESVAVDCQRTVNLYPQATESGAGKNGEVASLIATPGLRLFATAGAKPNRGLYATSSGRVFTVTGQKLYEITADGAAPERGTLHSVRSTTTAVFIADNGVQLFIADGDKAYVLTLADNTFTVVDTHGAPAGTATFQDGYFIASVPDTRAFFISSLYDGATWDPLDYAMKEGQADNLVRVLSDHRELVLFGERSTEVWFNSGAADFPFQRIQGAYMECGLAAAAAACKVDNSMVWPSQDRNGAAMIMRADNYTPRRVSTHAVETALAKYKQAAGSIAGATAWTYQHGGHSFYVLNIPGADTTWTLDLATNLWHERQHYTGTRHIAEGHAHAFGRHLVGDYRNGNIYEMDHSVSTDDDADPQAVLQISDDGGHSWSNEMWTSAGRIGEFGKRVIWRRLGRSRDRVFRVSIQDPNVSDNGDAIMRTRTAPHLAQEGREIFYPALQIDMEARPVTLLAAFLPGAHAGGN